MKEYGNSADYIKLYVEDKDNELYQVYQQLSNRKMKDPIKENQRKLKYLENRAIEEVDFFLKRKEEEVKENFGEVEDFLCDRFFLRTQNKHMFTYALLGRMNEMSEEKSVGEQENG